jgi:ABC-type multidrug transport system ATPase subunit
LGFRRQLIPGYENTSALLRCSVSAGGRKQPLLRVTNLSKYFGTLPALQQINLEVDSDQVLGIAGQSGAGKSTLAKLLAGLLIPDEGELSFDGKGHRWPFQAQSLGIEVIHQQPELAPGLDICSNIFMGNEIGWPSVHGGKVMFPRQQMEQRASQILEQLEVSFASLRKRVENLSGEQQQIIAIARAMVRPAKLMVIDDPTTLLSYYYEQKLLSFIQLWQEQGRAVIFCSNNLDHLFAVTDEIVVLRHGRKVARYKTDDVSREEVVAALAGTTDRQKITPIIWALDSYYRAREHAEKLRLNQMRLEHNIATQDELYGQLINDQVKALDEANIALQHAQRRLLTQREEERKHLARELHDRTIQNLLSVNYRLELVEANAPSVKDGLQYLREDIRKVIVELRNICGELRPPTIDSLGVGTAIRSFSKDWSAESGITVVVDIDTHLTRLPEYIESPVFRIV